MYRMDMYIYGHTFPYVYWNIDRALFPGDAGTDVMLVQYLLNYCELRALPVNDTHLIAVDGIWGPQTTAAIERLESLPDPWVVGDGFVSPIPPDRTSVHPPFGRHYKLVAMHWLFTYQRSGLSSRDLSAEDCNELVLEIPENFDCPAELGFALRAARGY